MKERLKGKNERKIKKKEWKKDLKKERKFKRKEWKKD